MTKRKRTDALSFALGRPWCYFCGRDFEDETILATHQRAKHFKCNECGKRLNSPRGLAVHASQVHKSSLSVLPNALPDRSDVRSDVSGMTGIPATALAAHKANIVAQVASQDGQQSRKKKIDVEEVDALEIQSKLDAHKEEVKKKLELQELVEKSLPYSIPAQYLSFYPHINYMPSPLAPPKGIPIDFSDIAQVQTQQPA